MQETDYKTANLGSIHSGSTPEWGRYPEEGNGNPFQYSCLGNFMDRGRSLAGPWGHKSWTQFSDYTHHHHQTNETFLTASLSGSRTHGDCGSALTTLSACGPMRGATPSHLDSFPAKGVCERSPYSRVNERM